MSYYSKDDLLLDPKQKSEQWANKKIMRFRNEWRNLINPKQAEDAMKILLSEMSMEEVKKRFKDFSEIDSEALQICVFEKVRNILIAERNKARIYIATDAIDPSAIDEKSSDYQLLKNRAFIEQQASANYQSIGLPEYKLANEKDKNGNGVFKGNTDDFDSMGLSDSDLSDIDYFFRSHYQLRHEIAGNKAINYYVKFNNLKDNIELWCNDIMAKKAIAMRCFVNELSGAVEMKYLAPESVKIIPGQRKDGKDAKAIGYEIRGSVGDFLKVVGKQFDWNTELPRLLAAVNFSTGKKYTGVFDGQGEYKTESNLCEYGTFIKYEISFGYIEWKEWDADAYKVGTDFHGNERMIPIAVKAKVTDKSKYAKELFCNEVTYKAYYLVTGEIEHVLYKYGKLFHQAIDQNESSEDELTNYSILVRVQEGPTAVKVAKPWIKVVQEVFYRCKQLYLKAKEAGTDYDFNSAMEIANMLYDEGAPEQKLKRYMAVMKESVDGMHVAPKVDGHVIGGGGNPNFVKQNGLDPMFGIFQLLIDWAAGKISSDLGINALREGYSPDPKDGLKLGLQALAQSRNATDYMSVMIMSILEQTGYYSLWITQDIIRYKDSIAYRFLKQALGEETVKTLEELKGFSFHRYAIFINTFNNDIEVMKLQEYANLAYSRQEIDFPTLQMIMGIDDPKKAGYELAYAQARADKKLQEQEQAKNESIMAQNQQLHDQAMAQIQEKGKWVNQAKEIEGKWYYEALKQNANAQVQKQIIKDEGEDDKQKSKAEAAIIKAQGEVAVKQQYGDN